MFSLSKESEQDLTQGLLELVGSYLEAREQTPPRLLGLIAAQQVMDELEVSYNTLKRWEEAGLKRYQPPVEDSRKVYYRISDILAFLGVENG